MKKFQVMLLMISLFLFICPSLLFAEDWHEPYGSCNTLRLKVVISAPKGVDWVISPMSCSSGSMFYNPVKNGKTFLYLLKGSGISCEFTAYNGKHPRSVNKYKFSQNDCWLKGGQINAKRVSGPFLEKIYSERANYNVGAANRRGYLQINIIDTYKD